MINETEKATADYLLALPKDEREAAAARISQLVKAQAPPSDAEPAPPPVRSLGEYLEDEIEVPPFLVCNGQLVRGEITVMVARAGKGKTTLGMNRMIRWAAGRPLFDELDDTQVPEKPLRIMMIENEGAAYFMQSKLGLLLREGAGLTEQERVQAAENILVWGDGGYTGLKVDRDNDFDLIKRATEEHKPDVVLMEPFRGIWTGEENDATAMEEVLDRLVTLAAEYKCGILLAHHERKSGAGEDGEEMSRARGSGALEGKVAVMENWRSIKNDTYRELSWSKSRYAPKQPPIRMVFNHATWRYELVPESEIGLAVLGMMTEDPDSWFWINEICEVLDESRRKVTEALDDLKDAGKVVRQRGTDERRGYRFRLKTGDDDSSGRLDIT